MFPIYTISCRNFRHLWELADISGQHTILSSKNCHLNPRSSMPLLSLSFSPFKTLPHLTPHYFYILIDLILFSGHIYFQLLVRNLTAVALGVEFTQKRYPSIFVHPIYFVFVHILIPIFFIISYSIFVLFCFIFLMLVEILQHCHTMPRT